MYQVITLQEGSRHLNLCRAEGFWHQRCLFLNFQVGSVRKDLMNTITIHKLLVQWMTGKWDTSTKWDTLSKTPLNLSEIHEIGSVDRYI